MSAPPRESIADLGKEVARDAAALVQAEIGYAKARALETAMALRGLVVVAVIAVATALLALIFVLATIAVVLAGWLFPGHAWAAWLLVTVILLVICGSFALSAVRRVRRISRTTTGSVSELKEDLAWVRQLIKRSSSAS